MGEASPDVVPGAVEWDLGFIFEATESGAVNDAFAVSLEFGAEVVRFFGVFATEAFATFRGDRRKIEGFFFLNYATQKRLRKTSLFFQNISLKIPSIQQTHTFKQANTSKNVLVF